MGISGERINMGRLKSWILTTFYKNELLEIKKEYEIKVRALGYITDTIEAETEEEAREKIKRNISGGLYEGDFDISYEISCIKRI